jgi:hypothetical protein
MATYRKKLLDKDGNTIIPAMAGDETGWVNTADLADGSVTEGKMATSAIKNIYTTGYSAATGANADLNTLALCQPGTYRCPRSADAASLSNCPTKQAFRMEVYNVTEARTQIPDTANWVYLIRKITDYAGREWIQSVKAEDTWTYSAWVMTTAGSTDGEIAISNVLTAESGFTVLEGRAYRTGKLLTLWVCIKKNSGYFGASERVATISRAYRALWTMNGSCTLTNSQWAAQKTGYLYMGASSTEGSFLVSDTYQASEHPTNIAKIQLTYPLAE